MTRVIAHPRQPLDHCRHARQGPQIGSKTMSLRSLAQRHIDTPELLAINPWLTTCPTGTAQ